MEWYEPIEVAPKIFELEEHQNHQDHENDSEESDDVEFEGPSRRNVSSSSLRKR